MFDECFYFNVIKLARQIDRLWTDAYRTMGLSPSLAYSLQYILGQPGITPNELSIRMDLEFSTVTRFIDSLVLKGLVERRKESKDKREINIYATDKGKSLKPDFDSISSNLHKNIREILGTEKVTDVISIIKHLSKVISNI